MCQSGGCQVGRAVQLVGPAPTLHVALGGRQASAGCGPTTGGSAFAQPSGGCTKAWWPPRVTTTRCSCRVLNLLSVVPVVMALTSMPRCHASGSSKRSLRRAPASVTMVSSCRAAGSRDYASARPRWPCDGACPPRRLIELLLQEQLLLLVLQQVNVAGRTTTVGTSAIECCRRSNYCWYFIK